jgi:hypothetical protein
MYGAQSGPRGLIDGMMEGRGGGFLRPAARRRNKTRPHHTKPNQTNQTNQTHPYSMRSNMGMIKVWTKGGRAPATYLKGKVHAKCMRGFPGPSFCSSKCAAHHVGPALPASQATSRFCSNPFGRPRAAESEGGGKEGEASSQLPIDEMDRNERGQINEHRAVRWE